LTEYKEVCKGKELDLEMDMFNIISVPGGPNSLFEALGIAMGGEEDSALEFRDECVDWMSNNLVKLGFENNAAGRNEVLLFKNDNVFAGVEMLKAFVDKYGVPVIVHYKDGPQVKFGTSNEKSVVHLQCVGGMHFNALEGKTVFVNECLEVQPENECTNGNEISERPEIVLHYLEENDEVDQTEKNELLVLDNSSTDDMGDEGAEEVAQGDNVSALDLGQAGYTKLRLLLVSPASPFEKKDGAPRPLKRYMSRLSADDSKIYYTDWVKGRAVIVPLITKDMVTESVETMHTEMGHTGRNKTLSACRLQFFHPKLWKVVADCIKQCQVCQRFKTSAVPPHRKEPVFKRAFQHPYEMYAVDLMELPRSNKGYKALLVGVYMYSKFANAVPIRSKTSAAVASAMERCILSSMVKIPEKILSDNGPEFRGEPFQSLLKKYSIEGTRSIPYRAQTNGGVERLNRTIKARLAAVVDGNYKNWDCVIDKVMVQYNRTVHDETQRAPAEFFSKQLVVPVVPAAEKMWTEPGVNFKTYVEGELVLRRVPYRAGEDRNKLAPSFDGPYKITKVVSAVVYEISPIKGKYKKIIVHYRQIKPYHNKGKYSVNQHSTKVYRRREVARVVDARGDIDWNTVSGIQWVTSPVVGSTEDRENTLSYVSVLPEQLDEAVGSWDMVDAGCHVFPRASTPQKVCTPLDLNESNGHFDFSGFTEENDWDRNYEDENVEWFSGVNVDRDWRLALQEPIREHKSVSNMRAVNSQSVEMTLMTQSIEAPQLTEEITECERGEVYEDCISMRQISIPPMVYVEPVAEDEDESTGESFHGSGLCSCC
jgi:hypothetical protein